jgi:hypothetical protein
VSRGRPGWRALALIAAAVCGARAAHAQPPAAALPAPAPAAAPSVPVAAAAPTPAPSVPAPVAAAPTPASTAAASPAPTRSAAIPAPLPVASAPIAGEPPDDSDDGWTRGKLVSLGGLAGLYTGVGVWAYFAWYHGKPTHEWRWNGDGLFGVNTYAGGSDKLGHFWSNHVITRVTGELLMAGGWRQLPASLMAGGLCGVFFGAVEIKDAYYYEFSAGDFAADLTGAALGIAMMNWPALDRLIDFRVDYWPTDEYVDGFKDGDVNFAEDYSGQTYVLALHLSGLPGLTESRWARWGRFVDVVGGFQSVNYKPEPADRSAIPSQHLFVGAAINLQAVLEEVYGEPAERGRARTSHRIGHTIFEFVSPPYTTLRMAEADRAKPVVPAATGGQFP